MSVTTPEEFYAHLVRSRLLHRDALAAVREYLSQPGRPPAIKVAQWLVEQGYITVWQAERLLLGKRQFFLGKYKFLEPIAEGAMGVVFKAQHEVMGRVVALKVLSKARLSHPNAIARFQREVQAAASVNHPNIVTAFDAGQVGSTHFLVMEYIQGADLNAWLEKHKRIPVPWACEFIRQAALGLAHAHAQGLVHRDIKPANIMVAWNDRDSRPVVKILDLGLARLRDQQEEDAPGPSHDTSFELSQTADTQLTQYGAILGTPDYLAPEQILHHHEVDARTDIFGLGCTLFKILTGQLPYGGPNLVGKLQARVSPQAPPAVKLRVFLPDADPALEAIVDRMVEREPARRFQSAEEVAKALLPFAKTPQGAWESYRPSLPERGSDEIGSSQLILDPRLKQFLDELGGEAADAAPAEQDHRATRSLDRPAVLPGTPLGEPHAAQGTTAGKSLVPLGLAPNPISGAQILVTPPRHYRESIGKTIRHKRRAPWLWLAVAVALAVLAWPGYYFFRLWQGKSEAIAGSGSTASDSGLAFLWHGTRCANEIEDVESGQRRGCSVMPQHDAMFDELGRMQCTGSGYFHADEASAGSFWQQCHESGTFSLELVLMADSAQQGRIVTFGPQGANMQLTQDEERLLLWCRAKGRGLVELPVGTLPAGVSRHIVLSVRPGQLLCVMNGQLSEDAPLPPLGIREWVKGPLTFGDLPNRSNPWHGRIAAVTLRARFVELPEATQLYSLAKRRWQLGP